MNNRTTKTQNLKEKMEGMEMQNIPIKEIRMKAQMMVLDSPNEAEGEIHKQELNSRREQQRRSNVATSPRGHHLMSHEHLLHPTTDEGNGER